VTAVAACGRTGSPPDQAPAAEEPTRLGTGSVTTIVPTEADAQFTRVEELLRRVPGLVVSRIAGGYRLRIRGQHSVQGGAADDDPLLVIDGVPVASGALSAALAGLAPRDVARIEVLKDAAATSVWGSRGGNGVIVITTKRGR
jgi:TonB-dependent SusC/RagA subfamily outer membrane receptor